MIRVIGAWMSLALSGCVMLGYELEPAPDEQAAATGSAGVGVAPSSGFGGSSGNASGIGSGAGQGGSTAPTLNVDGGLPDLCLAERDGTPCEDGLPCTTQDACMGGKCTSGPRLDCTQLDDLCAKGVCDEATGECVAAPVFESESCGEGAFCSHGRCARVIGDCDSLICDRLCPGGSAFPCSIDCGDSDICTASCEDASTCVVACGADRCEIDCDQDAFCSLDCSGADRCEARCADGSICIVDCTGAADCGGLRCEDGAQCGVICQDAGDCGFEVCSSGQQTCPNGIVACGRCPPTNGSFGG